MILHQSSRCAQSHACRTHRIAHSMSVHGSQSKGADLGRPFATRRDAFGKLVTGKDHELSGRKS
jgi:hypothetical protein